MIKLQAFLLYTFFQIINKGKKSLKDVLAMIDAGDQLNENDLSTDAEIPRVLTAFCMQRYYGDNALDYKLNPFFTTYNNTNFESFYITYIHEGGDILRREEDLNAIVDSLRLYSLQTRIHRADLLRMSSKVLRK